MKSRNLGRQLPEFPQSHYWNWDSYIPASPECLRHRAEQVLLRKGQLRFISLCNFSVVRLLKQHMDCHEHLYHLHVWVGSCIDLKKLRVPGNYPLLKCSALLRMQLLLHRATVQHVPKVDMLWHALMSKRQAKYVNANEYRNRFQP